MLTTEQAQKVIEKELQNRKLTKPMTPAELLEFCQEMYVHLEFRCEGDRLDFIRAWAERWQSDWLRTK